MTENKLTLRLRTKDNLLELLTAGKSAAWKVGKNKENEISKVQIFNFEGTLMLEASLDISNTSRREDNRLIVGLGADAKIIKCDPPLLWKGMSPIRYFHENSQEESEETEEESSSESIIVECYKKGSQLKIRVVSPGYNPELNVRFPKDLREEGARYAVEILEEVQGKYYTAKGKIEKLELEELEKSDLQILGENIPDFAEIIKDFLSETNSYSYVEDDKTSIGLSNILSNWEAIKANGKKQEVIDIAKKWASLIINEYMDEVAYSDTKIDLFKEFNLSFLIKQNLLLHGGVFAIEKTGDIITENNPNNLLVISKETYAIIRILMTEIIWQVTRENLSLESVDETVSIIRKLINHKDLFMFPNIEFCEDSYNWGNMALTKETYDSGEFDTVLDYHLKYEVGILNYNRNSFFYKFPYLNIDSYSNFFQIMSERDCGFRIVRKFPMNVAIVRECLYLLELLHRESGFGWYVNTKLEPYPTFCAPGF